MCCVAPCVWLLFPPSVVHAGEDVFLRGQFLLFPLTIISISSKVALMVNVLLVVQNPKQRPLMELLGYALDHVLLFSLCFNSLRSL